MKKLIIKDKKLRNFIHEKEKKKIILKTIFKNSNLFTLIRWNAFSKMKKLTKSVSEISISNRCVYTVNKKRLNKTTLFSRHVFLKLIRSGKITNISKSSW
jgi:ribosomal protein S14